MNPALVQLSLLSPALERAAVKVGDALTEGSHARKRKDIQAAGKRLGKAIAELRAAAAAYSNRPWRR